LPFGALLRSIVVTIDEHCLKRKYLKIHDRAVATFFNALAERIYETDASQALQERLLRNRERLFTFLQHDGVSWNNNLAENAIKRISDYREDVGRSVKEAGFTEQFSPVRSGHMGYGFYRRRGGSGDQVTRLRVRAA
jgi:hypothetical protein